MRMFIIFLTFISAFAHCQKSIKTYIPNNAKKYQDYVLVNNLKLIPDLIKPWYFDSLIEHETCVSLCSRRCWSPKARLKTKREEGAGLGQITRVFNRNGTTKWDMLRTLKFNHYKQLKNLTWKNIYDKPNLQVKALLLLWKSDFDYYKDKVDYNSIIWFADSAYNGGFKWLNRERELCKFTKHCNPKKWFNNVADIKSARARRKLYGNRSAWDINRHHVNNVRDRMLKYEKYYERYLDNKYK